MHARRLVMLNLALAFYNAAMIWLFQLDIYPSWSFVPTSDFVSAEGQHLLATSLSVFPAAVAATVVSVLFVVRRPMVIDVARVRIGAVLQVLSWLLTAFVFGPWQGRLTEPVSAAKDQLARALGPANDALYHTMMIAHWGRVAVVSAYAMLAWSIAAHALVPAPVQRPATT